MKPNFPWYLTLHCCVTCDHLDQTTCSRELKELNHSECCRLENDHHRLSLHLWDLQSTGSNPVEFETTTGPKEDHGDDPSRMIDNNQRPIDQTFSILSNRMSLGCGCFCTIPFGCNQPQMVSSGWGNLKTSKKNVKYVNLLTKRMGSTCGHEDPCGKYRSLDL